MSSILTLAGNNTSDASFYLHTVDQSLRLEDGDSARLTRTPSSAGNRRTWTWSAWIKRGNISLGNKQRLFATQTGGGLEENFRFETSDTIRWYCHNATGESSDNDLTTNAVFRDVAAWYHIVVVKDTTESTAANRNRLYVNGVLQSWAGTNYASSNYEGFINQTNQHAIAAHAASVLDEFDGYMSDVVFLDGVAGDPTTLGLGELKDEIWVPKDVSGLTYGTNGFHLDFADSSAIGNDVSGNDNDWTPSGLAATDVVPDSPTNNFAVLQSNGFINVGGANTAQTLSEGNLKFTGTSNEGRSTPATIRVTSGKYYVETTKVSGSGSVTMDFIVNGSRVFNKNVSSTGDIIMGAVDVDAGKYWSGLNNTWDSSGNPATGANPTGTFTANSSFTFSGRVYNNTRAGVFNFGQDSSFAGNKTSGSAGASDTNGIGDFYYTPPTDYLTLCSANLPAPAIIDASEYFNTVLYSGNSGTQAITGVGFQPDWVWMKSRNHTYSHGLFDSVRGATKKIYSNSNTEEVTESGLTSFDADGFTLGSTAGTNASSKNYVSWNWLAGTAVSGATTGSGTAKTYTGSVNTEAGLSIIKYVGNGTSGHTIPHNLTTTPNMIIVKRLDSAGGWRVQHKDVAATHYLALDTNAAKANLDTIFNDTAFDSTVFTVGNASSINGNDKDYIAYCFTDIDQYCKAGVYSGNGNADGPYIHLGFRPALILTKRTNSTGQWDLLDSTRETFNEMGNQLRADASNAEASNDHNIDFLSNGFKWRDTSTSVNSSGSTYIYLAFAEQPFKYSNAR